MSDDLAPRTIGNLKSVLSELARQAKGDEAGKPFFTTLFDVFGVDTFEDLLEKHFDTKDYNDEWVNIVQNGENEEEQRFERTDGVRCRFAIVFLDMWKKALMRARDDMTDVEKLWSQDFGQINSAYDSLTHTNIKLGIARSGVGGGGNG